MADFGDFSTNDFNAGDFEVEDPTADFLARERAILGEDADFIATGTPKPPEAPNGSAQDDLFGFEEVTVAQQIPLPTSTSNRYQTTTDFTSSDAQFGNNNFTDYNPVQVPVSGSLNHLSSPSSNSFSTTIPNDAYGTATGSINDSSLATPEVDSEFIRNWRSQFQDRLGDRDRREKEKQQQILTDAKAELEKFRQDYESKRQSKIQAKGRVTSNLNDGRDGKSGWDLVQHLIAPQPSSQGRDNRVNSQSNNVTTKDTSRVRSVIQDLAVTGAVPQIRSL